MKWFHMFAKRPAKDHSHMVFGVHCPKKLCTSVALRDFRFLHAIGHGYASTVFETEHVPSNLRCVVKTVMKRRLSSSELQRIRREIEIHSNITNSHILTFYIAFEDEYAYYLVLEHAEGGDLYQYLYNQHNRRMSSARYVSFVLHPLLFALVYLHNEGIIHRDIKPENLLIDSKGRIRLCDFGMSIRSNIERPCSVLGTLEYMAPEVISKGEGEVFSSAVDVWAIGVLTYECLTGKTPFKGPSERAVIKNITDVEYDRKHVDELDARDFIDKCLKRDPTKRPSVRDLLRHPFLCQETRRSFSFSA